MTALTRGATSVMADVTAPVPQAKSSTRAPPVTGTRLISRWAKWPKSSGPTRP
jgi:hypothetical protein